MEQLSTTSSTAISAKISKMGVHACHQLCYNVNYYNYCHSRCDLGIVTHTL